MSQYIFTKHALQRLQERSITQSMAESVLANPEYTQPGKKHGTVKFVRNLQRRNVQLVATYLDDQKKWLVISAWVRGEEDKVPFMWQLITLPFKLVGWMVKKMLRF